MLAILLLVGTRTFTSYMPYNDADNDAEMTRI